LWHYESTFYDVFAPAYECTIMHSLFTTQDFEEYKALIRPVARKFSMSAIPTFEPLVDPWSEIFCQAMEDMAGQPADLSTWLLWYAFDIIRAITFSQRFGSTEEQRKVNNIIEGLELVLWYGGLVG
jgi:hypothetical protein